MAEKGSSDSILDSINFGIKPEAMSAWRALSDAQEKHEYYPCANNPYFYMDHDGRGLEDDKNEDWLPVGLTADDCESLCYGCPLLKQCYDFAVVNEETFGVWGGIDMSVKPDTLF